MSATVRELTVRLDIPVDPPEDWQPRTDTGELDVARIEAYRETQRTRIHESTDKVVRFVDIAYNASEFSRGFFDQLQHPAVDAVPNATYLGEDEFGNTQAFPIEGEELVWSRTKKLFQTVDWRFMEVIQSREIPAEDIREELSQPLDI